jgi:predicted nucleic acid-binding protein
VSEPKRLVVDANILIRAVFGKRVYQLLKKYSDAAEFYSPDRCIEEAHKHLARVAVQQKFPRALAETVLDQLVENMILTVDRALYEGFEESARARISARDADDWPIVATALLLNAPIWTEDDDFFGTGIATWTTDRIELYLRDT